MADPLSELSKDVLQTLNRWKLPVNPFDIAKDEDIQLAPGEYGDGFDAQIEYVPEVKRFVIYYRLPGPGRPDGRVHFSIAHELGHFYIREHRKRLLKGDMHNSESDFQSRDPRENEADEFAANLLMPKDLFIQEVQRFRQRVCTLKEICKMADEKFGTSITSTARRYCQCDIEACSIVVSKGGIVRWAMHSDDMKARNMRYIPAKGPVPAMSKTARLWDALDEDGIAEPVEGSGAVGGLVRASVLQKAVVGRGDGPGQHRAGADVPDPRFGLKKIRNRLLRCGVSCEVSYEGPTLGWSKTFYRFFHRRLVMATAVGTRFKTGEKCIESGRYGFDGYLDGTSTPSPKPEEREIPLSKGETFPPIRSSGKACWWKLLRRI